MKHCLIILAIAGAASGAAAQTGERAKPLGVWDVEYDRVIGRMHGEPTHARDRGRITLRAVGDSLFGDLLVGDSVGPRFLLRGTSRANTWSLYMDSPTPRGFAVLLTAAETAMEWLRDKVHGFEPAAVRFELVVRGDSLTGTRIQTGFPETRARTSLVRGRRLPQ